jgi:hypothetical protein
MDFQIAREKFPNISELWEYSFGIIEVRTQNGRLFRVGAERGLWENSDETYHAHYEEEVIIRVGELDLSVWRTPDIASQEGKSREECIKRALVWLNDAGKGAGRIVWIDPFKKVYHANMICSAFPEIAISMRKGIAEADGYSECAQGNCCDCIED